MEGTGPAVLVTVEAAGNGREQARTGERVGAVGEQGGDRSMPSRSASAGW